MKPFAAPPRVPGNMQMEVIDLQGNSVSKEKNVTTFDSLTFTLNVLTKIVFAIRLCFFFEWGFFCNFHSHELNKEN